MFLRFLFCLLLLCAVSSQATAQQYTIMDLGPVVVSSIDPEGALLVGTRLSAMMQLAAILGDMTEDLGALPGGSFSFAKATRGGVICGASGEGIASLHTHAFVFTRETGVVDLGTTGGPELFSAATGCNSIGGVSGYGDSPDGTRVLPLRWQDGALTILPTLSTGNATANSINASGDSAGFSTTSTGMSHAVVWPNVGGIVDIHTLGTSSIALQITDGGWVYGDAQAGGHASAFVFMDSTGMVLLPPLPGDTESHMGGGNNAGVAVGSSVFLGPAAPLTVVQAVRWDDGVPTTLLSQVTNPQGWFLVQGRGINEAGTIVGLGRLEGSMHAFAMFPVILPPAAQVPPPEDVPVPDPAPPEDKEITPGKHDKHDKHDKPGLEKPDRKRPGRGEKRER